MKDTPENRGYQWTLRRREVRQRDDYTCQRCGRKEGQSEKGYREVVVHHIIPGKKLEIERARLGENLVSVCTRCHSKLEGRPVQEQLAELGRNTDRRKALLSALHSD